MDTLSPPKPYQTTTSTNSSSSLFASQTPASATTSTTAAAAAAATATPTSSTAANAVNGTTSTLASRAQGLSPGTTTSPYGTSTVGTAGMYGNSYGVGNSYSSPYGTTGYGGYGATGMYGNTSMYGNSSMYGSSPYGGYGGYGTSSMYGGGYGGYGGYGASSMYGGGYGGYGMNRFGGMYGNPYSMDPSAGGIYPQLAFLGGLQSTMSSLGQMSDLLGMNADAMQYAFVAFMHFIERVGGTAHTMFGFFSGTPPPVPIDPRTGQPMIDPNTGQPFVQLSPDEFAKERRRKLFRIALGLVILFFGYRLSKYLFSKWFSSYGNKAVLEDEWHKMSVPARQRQMMMSQQFPSLMDSPYSYQQTSGYTGMGYPQQMTSPSYSRAADMMSRGQATDDLESVFKNSLV